MANDLSEVLFCYIKDLLAQKRFLIVTGDFSDVVKINPMGRSVEIYAYKLLNDDSCLPQPRSIYSDEVFNIRVNIFSDSIMISTWEDKLAVSNLTRHDIDLCEPCLFEIIKDVICLRS